jgi:hypothetical protein
VRGSRVGGRQEGFGSSRDKGHRLGLLSLTPELQQIASPPFASDTVAHTSSAASALSSCCLMDLDSHLLLLLSVQDGVIRDTQAAIKPMYLFAPCQSVRVDWVQAY